MPYSLPSPLQQSVDLELDARSPLFEPVVLIEVALAGYVSGHMIHAKNPIPISPVRHVCFAEQAEVECDAQPLLDAIVKQSWPSVMRLKIDTMPASSAFVPTTELTGVQRLTGGLFAQGFLSYYESIADQVAARFGANLEAWPETLRFARVVRNAFAHDGKLTIRGSPRSATWRGKSLGVSNNGEPILYNHLGSGDVVLLGLDVNALMEHGAS